MSRVGQARTAWGRIGQRGFASAPQEPGERGSRVAGKDGKKTRRITDARDPAAGRSISVSHGRHGDPDEPRRGLGSRDWTFLACAGVIVVGALLLRLYRIGEQELWLDETFSFYMATWPHEVGRLLTRTNSPPLYYLLLRGWVAVAGASEAALRLPSALAGTLFVAAVIWAGREIFDTRIGLWSGGVAAVAPMHIYYSQEARAYALLTLLLILTHGLLWRALQRNTWSRWTLVAVATLLALYTHYYAILGLLPGALLVWMRGEHVPWRRYLGTMLAGGLLFLPWIVWAFVLTTYQSGLEWMGEMWQRTPPLLAIPRSLEVLALGAQAGLLPIKLKQFTELVFPSTLRLLGLTLLLLLGLWVAVPWGDGRLGLAGLRQRKAWLALLLAFPLGVLWLVSFYRAAYVVGRHDLIAFPAYSLLLGLALCKLQRVHKAGPLMAAIVALLLAIPIGTKLSRYYGSPSKGEGRLTAEVLHAGVEDDDVVVFTGLRGFPILYYLGRLGYRWEDGYCQDPAVGRRLTCRMYPREWEQKLRGMALNRTVSLEERAREDVQEFLRALPPHRGTVWVVFDSGVLYPDGRILLPEVDALLVKEFRQAGLRALPIPGPFVMLRFRRSSDG